MSNAEELAAAFERGEEDVSLASAGKRSKAEKVEHKHPHPEGDTRRIVNNAMSGEEKRKEQNVKEYSKEQSKEK
ncbi:DNA-binding nuclear phosphoprotein p8 domain-containing protein [Ditylenchus destructor]|uniref:DNA-binding nuclear phosphoprotein p8 domain-containing protein n=1 Tax=Ditylenchus destructor TaxID=166010 RepID=A0AAD4NHN6_9BILA|nr:DNA-binding nuclear phosphoprotein p8 domain-containing protein [Ditylenchus destructor]